ncbi:transcriptional regulator KorA [Streptomyces sp. NBC_00247]|uniref:hypothetical protein n=1 Tax=Streptomyces sp. NBC_00247 TaxID=2975689 RepID=UPI002E2B40A4|nr:hypothetical protein [Streptomyces sp. NBC_00247]
MADTADLSPHEQTFDRVREARDRAVHHTRPARESAVERRDLMQGLIGQGVSQADIAREPGVSRQAVQKMPAC